MKTAIIGLGNIGSRVAANLVAGGQSVIVSERSPEKARARAGALGAKAQVMPVEDAIKTTDVLILAIYFDAIREFIDAHRRAIVGKVVVDPSNPIAPDGKGGFKKIIPADQSSGKIIAGLLAKGAELVKAFGSLVADSLRSAGKPFA
jgi:predicted dinucleotide-binding enzyme